MGAESQSLAFMRGNTEHAPFLYVAQLRAFHPLR